MKTLFASVIALLFTTNSFAQDTLLKSTQEPSSKTAYNIGKSIDPEVYPADSIPLFVIKGGGKSKRISPAKILELKPKGNNLANVFPEFIESVFVLDKKSVPIKYKNEGTSQVVEIYLLSDKVGEAFKFLKDKGYTE
jgi:hypothetical protein